MMPIPVTTPETTAVVAARMIREERAESQRLRDLLTRARVGLEQAGIALRISGLHNDASATDFALHLSDPSRDHAQPEGVSNAD